MHELEPIGIVLTEQSGGARRFCEALQSRGLLCKETHHTVIRVAPPLTITRAEIDQMLAFEEGVNVTLGLPIVRTSVDHGTALDLAGTGKADTGSLRAALQIAIELGSRQPASPGEGLAEPSG